MGSRQPTPEQTVTPAAQARVVMYATRSCPYCLRARALLRRKRVSVEEIDVDADVALWLQMETLSGRSTVPQIFIGGQPVGGYDDMAALDRAGRLDTLLFPKSARGATS